MTLDEACPADEAKEGRATSFILGKELSFRRSEPTLVSEVSRLALPKAPTDESLGGRRLTTDDVVDNVIDEGITDDDVEYELELYLPIRLLSFRLERVYPECLSISFLSLPTLSLARERDE